MSVRLLGRDLKKICVNIDIVSGCVNGKRQSVPIGNGAAVNQHVAVLPLQLRSFGKLISVDNLQVIQAPGNDQKEQSQEQLPDSQTIERRAWLAAALC